MTNPEVPKCSECDGTGIIETGVEVNGILEKFECACKANPEVPTPSDAREFFVGEMFRGMGRYSFAVCEYGVGVFVECGDDEGKAHLIANALNHVHKNPGTSRESSGESCRAHCRKQLSESYSRRRNRGHHSVLPREERTMNTINFDGMMDEQPDLAQGEVNTEIGVERIKSRILGLCDGYDAAEHALVNELAYILGPEFLDHHPPLTTREDVIKAVTSLVLERNGKQ